MKENGESAFLISKVVKELENHGVILRSQSIYNTNGECYKKLISVFRDNSNDKIKNYDQDLSTLNSAIELIPDNSIRVILRMKLSNSTKLYNENIFLRSAFKRLQLSSDSNILDDSQNFPINDSNDLPEYLIKALIKGIDLRRLEERGLIIQSNGSIKYNEQILFPPSFVTAITAIIQLYSKCSEDDEII